MEEKVLHLIDGVLIRVVDDFLLITLEHHTAKKFVEIMHNGIPEFGARVNPSKTLVNFDIEVNGIRVNKIKGTLQFPYCGITIHTKTLAIMRDFDKRETWSKWYIIIVAILSNYQ